MPLPPLLLMMMLMPMTNVHDRPTFCADTLLHLQSATFQTNDSIVSATSSSSSSSLSLLLYWSCRIVRCCVDSNQHQKHETDVPTACWHGWRLCASSRWLKTQRIQNLTQQKRMPLKSVPSCFFGLLTFVFFSFCSCSFLDTDSFVFSPSSRHQPRH